MFAQTILGKLLRKKQRINVKLGTTRNVWHFLCIFFDYYCQSLISGRDTGHWVISPRKFKICLIFLYFLKSQVLSRSATLRQLVYQVYYTRYYVSFYWCSIESVLKHCQVPKYYDHDCLKIFFWLSILGAMILITKKNSSSDSKKLILLKNHQ